MALALDRRALRRGGTTYLAIAAPCGLLIALTGGSGTSGAGTGATTSGATSGNESPLWIVAALVIIVVAPLVAGVVAGSAQQSPLVHGALAVAVPAGVFLVIRVIVGMAQHRLTASDAVTFLLYLAVFTALGMLGGYLGFRRNQRLA